LGVAEVPRDDEAGDAKSGAAKPGDVKLVRREEGYATPDGRFEVSGSPGSWYAADDERVNPLGLPTILGPFRTLGEVREAIREAEGGG
jgi:hypothetical protein